MTKQTHGSETQHTRRDFLKTTAAVGAAAATLSLTQNVHAAGSDTIKVGLIGCGGRGSGAADNVLHSARGVQIVALADVFKGPLQGCRGGLLNAAKSDNIKNLGNSVDLPDSRCFVGLDAYEKLLATDINYVILATPPGFRPIHIEAAVAKGKNIFTEKPVGVDGAGIRRVLAAKEQAEKNSLGIAAGTQRRHQTGYLDTMKQIHDGAIGDIVSGRCYWNQGDIWFRSRQAGMSDVEYQLHNWYHFVWLCGDHICEQHVHNLDVMNWALKSHPLRAHGMGGRTARPVGDASQVGQIFDHFAVEYEYPNGVRVFSYCRQINGCDGNVSEALAGTRGHCQVNAYQVNGKRILTRGKDNEPYVQEHTDLIASIRAGKPINELQNVAESTLTAIQGRMATYTGKSVTWDQALNSRKVLMPEKLELKMDLPVDPVAIPGKTPLA